MTIPNPKTFIGSGKMEEVKNYIKENEVIAAIFDDELHLHKNETSAKF